MFKVWWLKLGIFIKKGIIWFYPLAVRARNFVNWRKVSKVSFAFLLYPILVFLFAIGGARPVAKFMVSPFDPVEKSNLWVFFLIILVSLLLPLASAVVYWLPRFLTSRFVTPFFKALVVTFALSPFVFLVFAFAEYILSFIILVVWLCGGYEEPYDPDKGRDPFNDPVHSQYLLHNEGPI